jgi:hypothetical protein
VAIDEGTPFAYVRRASRLEVALALQGDGHLACVIVRECVRGAFFIPIAAPVVQPLTVHLGNLVKRDVSAVCKQP